MKIQITAETTGDEISQTIINQLAANQPPITASATDIKAFVLNKDNKWIEVDYNKVKFVYNK